MKNKVFIVTANLSIFLFMLVVLALWSSRLLTEWGTDFGIYYAGAYFIDDEYRLYKELFDHKGPLYYLFLKAIGLLIGWGSFQAYLSLFLTLLAFYIPAFLILLRQNLSPPLLLSGVILCLLLLFGQNTNSSIAFFQGAFLLISFYFLTATKNNFNFILSLIFFVLAVFVRIDALVFLPIYFFYALHEEGDFSYKKNGLKVFLILSSFPLIFVLLSKALGFDFYEFYEHNIVFNYWYKSESILSIFYRPTHFSIISSSLTIIPIFLLRHRFLSLIGDSSKLIGKILRPNFLSRQAKMNFIYIGIFFLSTILWAISASDKNYHLLVFTIPLVFILLNNVRFITTSGLRLLIYPALALYPLALALAPPLKVLIKNPECITDPYCSSSKIVEYVESINFLSKQPNAEVSIIGGRGWTYFYSGKRPARSLNDWWLYYKTDPFLTDSLNHQHEKLLSGQVGNFFLVDNMLLNNQENRSPLLKEILANSVQIQDQGKYSIFRLSTTKKVNL